MPHPSLPAHAAWRHRDARDGFEVLFVTALDVGALLRGCTTAVEQGVAWSVEYEIEVDAVWRTRRARVRGLAGCVAREVRLEHDGAGRWTVDGAAAPRLDGCLDVDLESSACTNAFPVARLALPVGGGADAPAAYVRADDLRVERLEQRLVRLARAGAGQRFDYHAPVFDVRCILEYDEAGLVVEYPGIAVRVA